MADNANAAGDRCLPEIYHLISHPWLDLSPSATKKNQTFLPCFYPDSTRCPR